MCVFSLLYIFLSVSSYGENSAAGAIPYCSFFLSIYIFINLFLSSLLGHATTQKKRDRREELLTGELRDRGQEVGAASSDGSRSGGSFRRNQLGRSLSQSDVPVTEKNGTYFSLSLPIYNPYIVYTGLLTFLQLPWALILFISFLLLSLILMLVSWEPSSGTWLRIWM